MCTIPKLLIFIKRKIHILHYRMSNINYTSTLHMPTENLLNRPVKFFLSFATYQSKKLHKITENRLLTITISRKAAMEDTGYASLIVFTRKNVP